MTTYLQNKIKDTVENVFVLVNVLLLQKWLVIYATAYQVTPILTFTQIKLKTSAYYQLVLELNTILIIFLASQAHVSICKICQNNSKTTQ